MMVLPLLLACALAVDGPHGSAPAAVDDIEGLLDSPVVTGASKASERSLDAPATVTIISREELRRAGIRSLDEAINFLSVGMLTQDPLHSVEIGARGVLLTGDYGNHVLLVVDGHVLNEPWDGTAYFEQGAAIPFDLIDHIEVLIGPGSVLYGTNAMLGVIHVVTRSAKELGTVEVGAEGTALPPLDAAGRPELVSGTPGLSGRVSLLTGHALTLAGHPLELVLALEYYRHAGSSLTFARQTGLTQTVDGQTAPANYGPFVPEGTWGGTTTNSWWTEVPVALVKARWGDVSLWARGATLSRSSPYFGAFGISSASDFDAQNVEQDRWANAELSWTRELDAHLSLTARAFVDAYDYSDHTHGSMWSGYGSGDALPSGADPLQFHFQEWQLGHSLRVGADVLSRVDWLANGRLPLLLGVEARRQRTGADTPFRADDGTFLGHFGAYDVDEWLAAVYAQQRAAVLPWLHLNAGLRFELHQGYAPHLSPRMALLVHAPWDATIKALVSTAFRAPTGFERFAAYPGYEIANPTVRPEQLATAEVSYEQRFGRHHLLANVFVSQLTDLITFVPAPVEVTASGESWFANVGAVQSAGGSLEARGAWGPVFYGGSLTLASVQAKNHPLPASPTAFGNARVGFEGRGARPTLQVSAFVVGPEWADRAFATATAADGSTVGWSDAARVGPRCELRASASGALPWPGLTWRVTAGGALGSSGPYTVGPTQAPDPTRGVAAPVLAPLNNRLFVSTSLSWTLDPPR